MMYLHKARWPLQGNQFTVWTTFTNCKPRGKICVHAGEQSENFNSNSGSSTERAEIGFGNGSCWHVQKVRHIVLVMKQPINSMIMPVKGSVDKITPQ